MGLLLSLLEDEPVGINDFYVRYYTAQLLTALLQVGGWVAAGSLNVRVMPSYGHRY